MSHSCRSPMPRPAACLKIWAESISNVACGDGTVTGEPSASIDPETVFSTGNADSRRSDLRL